MNQTILSDKIKGDVRALVDYVLDDKEIRDFEDYIKEGNDPNHHIAYHAAIVGKALFGYESDIFDIIRKYEV